jgi:hypothetical protein
LEKNNLPLVLWQLVILVETGNIGGHKKTARPQTG